MNLNYLKIKVLFWWYSRFTDKRKFYFILPSKLKSIKLSYKEALFYKGDSKDEIYLDA